MISVSAEVSLLTRNQFELIQLRTNPFCRRRGGGG